MHGKKDRFRELPKEYKKVFHAVKRKLNSSKDHLPVSYQDTMKMVFFVKDLQKDDTISVGIIRGVTGLDAIPVLRFLIQLCKYNLAYRLYIIDCSNCGQENHQKYYSPNEILNNGLCQFCEHPTLKGNNKFSDVLIEFKKK